MTETEFLEQKNTYKNVDEVTQSFGGFGRFQKMLLACGIVMTFPSTFSILIMYFAALKPAWSCSTNSTVCRENGTFSSSNTGRCGIPRMDWEFTRPRSFSIVTQFDIYCEQEWIVHLSTSILFIGWAFGAVVLGWISDNYGRKCVIFPSYLLIMVVGFIAAFSPSVSFLIICRFIIGFFIPGAAIQLIILLSEFVTTKYRPYVISLIWFFFSGALCLLSLKAYFIMNWKVLHMVCTAPYLFVLAFYKFLPESARWLHLHDRNVDMSNLFHRIAYWNKKTIPEHFTILPLQRGEPKHKSNPLELFKTRRMAIMTSVQGYGWFVNAMVYYGLSLAASDLGGSLYTNFALMSAVEVPANVLAMFLCDKVGRKNTTKITMALGGIVCIAVAFIPSTGNIKIIRIVLAMLGKLCITISFNVAYTWSLEIYSTNIRAEGIGFLQVTSRMGAASSPWVAKGLKKLHSITPFLVMGTLCIIGAIACLVLPETKGKTTQDVCKEEDKSVSKDAITGRDETNAPLCQSIT